MNRSALVEYATRSRSEVADLKAAYWRERKERLGAVEAFRITSELRRHMRARRSEWPDEHERATDLAVHSRVGEALRGVAHLRSR